jgi:hypothetical protein
MFRRRPSLTTKYPGTREEQQWAQEMAAPKRLRMLAFVGNLLMLVGLLGMPYWRGRLRARAAWERYDALSRCVHGGDLAGSAARVYPLSDRAAAERARALAAGSALAEEAASFASRGLRAQRPLARTCGDALHAVAPASAIFLLPSLKRAEDDLREAVRVAALEFSALDTTGVLPQRPLRALLQLRALLTSYAREAGLAALPAPSAPALPLPEALPMPARLPLYAGFDAVISLWGDEQTLHAAALDGTGVSYVRLTSSIQNTTRLARPKLLRDLLVDEGRLLLVWGMPEARCPAGTCTGKATGIAQLATPLTFLPQPHWLAAHVLGRLDRTLLLGADALWMVAEAAGGRELRAFARDDLEADRDTPLAPSSTRMARDPSLVLSVGEQTAHFAIRSEGTRSILFYGTTRDRERAVALLEDAQGAGWVVACSAQDAVMFAFGDGRSVRVGSLDGVSPQLPMRLGAPLDARDRTQDRVAVLCREDGPLVLVRDLDDELQAVSCRAADCSVHRIATDVASYASVATNDGALLAFARDANSQIHTIHVDARGIPRTAPSVPGACWQPRAGMCGAPLLARVGQQIVLAARDGTDLAMLQSRDRGHSWQPTAGLPAATPRELVGEALRQRE